MNNTYGKKSIVISTLLIIVATVYSQSKNNIKNLYDLLYPTNVDTINIDFVSHSGSFSFSARDFYPDFKLAESILNDVRLQNQYNDIDSLRILLSALENTFVNEWEPIWRKDIRRYESFYHVLRNIEETLQYFYITRTIPSSAEKLKYVRNLILFEFKSAYADSDSIMIFSNYIHYKKHRACMGGNYCSNNILKDLWTQLERDIINEICNLDRNHVDYAYKSYINSLLIQSRNSKNIAFDSCFLLNWEVLQNYSIYTNVVNNIQLIYSIRNRNNSESIRSLLQLLDYSSPNLHSYLRLNNRLDLFSLLLKDKLRNLITTHPDPEIKKLNMESFIHFITAESLSEDIKFLKPILKSNEIDTIKSRFNQ